MDLDNKKQLRYRKQKETLLATKAKRHQQICKVIELKISNNHLNKIQQEQLKMFFLEAKWLYNHILSTKKPFEYDYKKNPIQKMNKDKKLEIVTLNYLPAKNKQTILKYLTQSIKNLSTLKKKGKKVGRLKFKDKMKSIDLDQYETTHKIVGNRFKINGIKKPLKVYGLHQIKSDWEFANAKLIKDPDGYFIKLTCFYFPKGEIQNVAKKDVGLDFGIKNTLTSSEGEVFKVTVEESEHLKRLQQKIAKSKKGSNNRYKLKLLLEKEYKKLTNKKNDAANKLVHYLKVKYNRIFIQDENIRGWKAGLYGRQVQHSILGRLKTQLEQLSQTTVIGRWEKSTKLCYICGKENNIGFNPVYKCECGLEEDRDVKAAKTIIKLGYIKLKIPMESREFKFVENSASVRLDQVSK
jgi:putative transposase